MIPEFIYQVVLLDWESYEELGFFVSKEEALALFNRIPVDALPEDPALKRLWYEDPIDHCYRPEWQDIVVYSLPVGRLLCGEEKVRIADKVFKKFPFSKEGNYE